jgi:RNA 2',3'-cyclic 3'-phosphodiesterase
MRLFIALDLPDTWKEALATLQDEMRDVIHKRFGDVVRPRWVRPEGIHLTLKFLGETPADRLDSLTTALAQAVPDEPGFSLALGRAGSFSDRRAPRVILATVGEDTEPLLALAERLETWLAASGWPRERRAFHPHLTLARLPDALDESTRHAVAKVTTTVKTPQTLPWNVDRVYLIRSHLGPGGARYERLAAFPN